MKTKLLLILLVLAFTLPANIRLSPYVLLDTQNPGTAIYIRYKITKKQTDAMVYYGQNDFSLSQAGDSSGVHLTGLTPGARYKFIVVSGDTSVQGSFRTSPPPGTPFSMALGSDTQEADSTVSKYIDSIYYNFHPDILLIIGDIVTATNLSNPFLCFLPKCSYDTLINHSKTAFANMILMPVLGNHDSTTHFSIDISTSYNKFFQVLPDSGREYTAQYGSVSFLMVDDSTSIKNPSLFTALANMPGPFKAACIHKPPALFNQFALEKAGARVIYSGHTHGSSLTPWMQTTYDSAKGAYALSAATTQTEGYALYCLPGSPYSGFSVALVDSLGKNNFNQTHYYLASGKLTKDPYQSFDMIPDPTALERRDIAIADRFGLRCTPNPFNRRVTIEASGRGNGVLSVFDVSGKRVFTAPLSQAGARQAVVWDAKDKPSGLYYVEFKTRGRVYGKKLSLVR